ncbi:MAG: hypothetical protein J5970_04860 [Bacilli bacterium]|nr:hypothetical protein [Bacilli bacterium]
MTKDDIWNLFVQTGNISYYLKYKEETKGFENYGNNKSERDNNKRKTI